MQFNFCIYCCRFHGAFTGGFSAGYFNSVGTKEGWTPKTFVSSRNQRAESKLSKPQDYMDDEVRILSLICLSTVNGLFYFCHLCFICLFYLFIYFYYYYFFFTLLVLCIKEIVR